MKYKYYHAINSSDFSHKPSDSVKNMTRAQKEEMLWADSKEPAMIKKFNSPQEYINYLRRKDLKSRKAIACLRSLRIELANNSVNWIQDFGKEGIDQILLLIRNTWSR